MKKFLLSIVLIVASITVSAQFQTLGLRMGFGGEISTQIGLGRNGRIECGLGLYNKLKEVTITYQLANELVGDLRWYYGLGATAGLEDDIALGPSIGAVGILGIEYSFRLPIQVSLDYRPVVYVIKSNKFFEVDPTGAGISVRYIFK